MCSGTKSLEEASRKVADAAKNWKSLTPAEHEVSQTTKLTAACACACANRVVKHYNHIANEKNVARQTELQAWIHSHTPDQIRIANNARALLRVKLARTLKSKKYPAHTGKLPDDRHVKPALSPYVLFSKERWGSGDFKSIKITDATKLIANEWKSLSASEKTVCFHPFWGSPARPY